MHDGRVFFSDRFREGISLMILIVALFEVNRGLDTEPKDIDEA